MLRKIVIACALPALFTLVSATAAETESSKTENLKRLIHQIGEGTVPPELLKAFVENKALPEAGTIGVWADYRQGNLDDDRDGNAKESEVDGYSAGVDYRITPWTMLGVALHRQRTDTESDASEPPVSGYSEIEDDSDGVSLYGSHTLRTGLVIDGSLSYMSTDTEITNFSALASPSTQTTDGNSLALDVGVNGVLPLRERLWAAGRASFGYVDGEQDGYTDEFGRNYESQDYELGTAALEMTLNYGLGEVLVPYAGINVAYDVVTDVGAPARVLNPGGSVATSVPYQDERDRFSYGLNLGISARLLSTLTANVSYRQLNWGSDLRSETLGANLRYAF